ncbi:MAG: hypothetical protein RDU20_04115 [Desulfomonilaceae bacterium]|nr:hypothetical protein [Desulfomonilaceae bacterium]
MVRKFSLSRLMSVALPVFLLTTFVTSVTAQGFFGPGFQGLTVPGGTCISGKDCGLGPLTLDARVGYGRVGLNFSLPTPFFTNLDLSFRDANVWIGALGARFESSSGVLIALKAQANASRRIGIETAEQAFDARNWDGSKLQWWTLEGDLGYRISSSLSALVGLRRDQMSVGLTNPRDAEGQPLDFVFSIPGLVEFSETYFGDFSSKLWIPYLGLEFTGHRFRTSLLYSPIAWADIKVPNRFFLSLFVIPGDIRVLEGFDLQYKVRKPSQFFEFYSEYDFHVSSNFVCRLWSSGSWMQLRGRGNVDELGHLFVSILGIPLVNISESDSAGGTATYTRSIISGGVSALVYF